MAYKKTVTPEQKALMIRYGTWAPFLKEREKLRAEGLSAYKASVECLKKYLPKPGQEPPKVPPPRPVFSNLDKEVEKYEAERAGKFFTEDGTELRAPGDVDEDDPEDSPFKGATSAPGDFDGGDMGDSADGVVLDEGEHITTEEVTGKAAKLKHYEMIEWVISHMDDSKVKLPKHSPSLKAWAFLKQCRDSVTFREKLLLAYNAKMMPKDASDKGEEEDDSFDGDNLVSGLSEVMKAAKEAQG